MTTKTIFKTDLTHSIAVTSKVGVSINLCLSSSGYDDGGRRYANLLKWNFLITHTDRSHFEYLEWVGAAQPCD